MIPLSGQTMSTAPFNATEKLPQMFTVRQRFARQAGLDLEKSIHHEIEKLAPKLQPDMRIAVGVGSRGITHLKQIVKSTLDALRSAGTDPFIIPAMGSHGGATAEAQAELLSEYGITEDTMGVPVQSTMSVQAIGRTADGDEVVWADPALKADGVLVINRIKPHTDFSGKIGSGLIKMSVVGLGKQVGASAFHRAASRKGYENTLRERFRFIAENTPLLGGLGLIENEHHETAHIEWVPKESFEACEEALFQQASDLMPKIPVDHVDLLIVDQIGKNISGAGMDPNVIGRSIHGYLTSPHTNPNGLTVRRIFVRDLTPETHGNAIGIGLADMTTRRLVESMDASVTFVNALTALSTNGAKVPIYFDTDREAIYRVLDTLALDRLESARIVRIKDTLNLEVFQASTAFHSEIESSASLEIEGSDEPMAFDSGDQLCPM